MKHEFISLNDAMLPIEELEQLSDELFIVRGGASATGVIESCSGLGCDCGCSEA